MMRATTFIAFAATLCATGASAQDDARAPAVMAQLQHELGPNGISADAAYRIAFADLNDDHQGEAVVYLDDPGYCGTGGCTTFVLTFADRQWHLIGRLSVSQLPIYRLPTHRNGWYDLAVRVSGGGVQPGMRIVSFGRGRYAGNPTKAPVLPRVPQEATLVLGVDSIEHPVGQ